MNAVNCSKCGTLRPPELAQETVRPPCPKCGGTSLISEVTMVETVSASSILLTELVPGNQARDWKQRWKQIEDELWHILQPHSETTSGESIHAAQQRLFSFFILTYHLKDALKEAAPGLRFSSSAVEDAITKDARLALLADLANLDKHMKPSRSPRSGAAPVIDQVSGVDRTGGGWQLSMRIKHGASMLDGLAVAEDAVKAWREKLTAWRLT